MIKHIKKATISWILAVSITIITLISGFIIHQFLSCTETKNNQPCYIKNIKVTQGLEKKYTANTRNKELIRICTNSNKPKSLDPGLFSNKQIMYLLFDGLVKWNAKGEIINNLAEKITQPNPTTIEITLKKGIKFHNNEELKADSVKYTLERLINKEINSPLTPLLNSIKGIKIINDYKLVIYLKNTDYAIIRKLAYVGIIPKAYYNRVGRDYFGKYPVGTGILKFYKWEKDGSLTLKINDNWYNQIKTKIKTANFRFIEELKTKKEQVQALTDNKIDLLFDVQGIYTLILQKNAATKVIKVIDPPLVYRMKLNSEKKPFDDINVRKAVNLAINRDLMIKVIEKGNGKKIATNSIDLDFGHKKDLRPYPYNLKFSRKLMEKYSKKPIIIEIVTTQDSKQIAVAVVKDIEAIGIKSKINVLTNNEMTKSFIENKKHKTIPWKYDMAIFSSKNPLFHAGIIYEEGLCPSGVWSLTRDKELENLCNQLKKSTSKDQELIICNKLEQLAYDNYWYTPIFQIISNYGAAKDLHIKIPVSTYIDINSAYYSQ